MTIDAEVDRWAPRFLTNAELVGSELPERDAVLADTFDLDRLWGPHEGHLLPDGLRMRVRMEGLPGSLTLLRTWLHQQSRSLRVLTQDWDEPEEEALLQQLADGVRERGQAIHVEDETHYIAERLSAPGNAIRWAVYDDPAQRQSRSLISALMSQPTTSSQHPLENQFSEALAFLVSSWHEFAAHLARLCGHETDRQLDDAVDSSELIGARTQVTLPVADLRGPDRRGWLFPDVSVEGSDRAFQILLEVKVDAELHHAVVGGSELLQPDAYAAAWRRLKDPTPARTRRVATLTRSPLDLHGADPMRGASITWHDIVDLIDTLQAPSELNHLAADFRQAVFDRILPPVIDPLEFAYLTEISAPLLDSLATTFAAALPGAPKISASTGPDFIRRYVYFDLAGQSLQLLARVTPRGARYNLPSSGPTLSLQFMTDADEGLPSELEVLALWCGMLPSRNRAGYHGFRRFVEIAQGLNAEAATALGTQLASELVDALTP